MKKMSNFVDHLECPSVDGIVFPNEMVQLLDVEVNWAASVKYNIKTASKLSIEELQKRPDFEWTSCAILSSTKDPKNQVEVLTGECDHGSNGFLVVIDLKTRKLIWNVFFNNSNPFVDPKVIHDDIYATSTNNCFWKFNLRTPAELSVECRKRS